MEPAKKNAYYDIFHSASETEQDLNGTLSAVIPLLPYLFRDLSLSKSGVLSVEM
jgi:hypothetical protein